MGSTQTAVCKAIYLLHIFVMLLLCGQLQMQSWMQYAKNIVKDKRKGEKSICNC